MRTGLTIAIVLATSAAAVDARALDTQACIAASEKGQHARAAGKLREARDQFNVCGNDACPAIVRRDCVQWQSEIVATLPTVVFGAKDKSGRDLFDVSVSMDGEVLTKKLDGKSVVVDPGPHSFKFEMAGVPPVIEKSLVKEGEKARVLTVTLDTGAEPPRPQRTDRPEQPTPEPTTTGGGHTVFPWILVGVGTAALVAGVVVYVTAPERPGNCSKSSETCTRLPGETDDQLRSDQDRAGKADSQPVVGLGIAAVGAVAIAGGLVWHFLEPTEASRSGMRVEPWVARGASGVNVGARF